MDIKGRHFVINNQERHMAVHDGHMKLLVLSFEPVLPDIPGMEGCFKILKFILANNAGI